MKNYTLWMLLVIYLITSLVLHTASYAVNLSSFPSLSSVLRSEAVSSGFVSVTNLSPIAITEDTGEKPQAKVWTYAGKHWAVLASSDGTNLWRLDGKAWTNVLRLSTKTSSKADCKLVGNTTHIFLYQGRSSQLVSVEYNAAAGTYQLWSKRTSTVGISLDNGVETATIDMDSKGRMWLASAGTTSAYVRWSDAPYNKWSAPITVATGIKDDDICAVVALPGKVGVFWSNQSTQRFGFKTHIDGNDPALWSSDEVPASQSAVSIGSGMSDDHMNIVAAGDGTLYCAVKTGYNSTGYPTIALLIRRSTEGWDKLYEVTQATGTRPIVVLNEPMSKVRVVYTTATSSGNIVYKESSTSNVAFGSQYTLISGAYNDATSTKIGFNSETVIMASNTSQAVSVLVSDAPSVAVPSVPVLATPGNGATGVSTAPTLSWSASTGADSYQAQVSTSSSFSSTVFDRSGLTTTSASISGLANSTVYYWRARATNAAGSSAWSTVWSFTTAEPELTIPSVPVLASPGNGATGVSTAPTLSWDVSTGADSYQAQVSTSSSFSSTVFDRSGLTTTSASISGLANSTVYYWRARATNAAGSSAWSTVWSFTTAPATAPTAPLVAHWKMDEGSGTTLSDASEYKNSATTVGGPTWVAGVSGQAQRFNGSGQYATANNNASLDITGNITLSAWIKPEKLATQYLIKKAKQSSVDGYELSLSSTGQIFFRFNQLTSGDTYRINSTTTHPTNGTTWIHVAATYDGSVMRLYINGEQNNSKTFSTPPPIKTNSLALSIAAESNGYRGFQGAMDEVRIYNSALSPSEVKELATVTTSIASTSAIHAAPLEMDLQEDLLVYPNPFKATATVNFTLLDDGEYTVKLYDSKGVQILDLKQGRAKAGEKNRIDIDGARLARGIYIVRLQSGRVVKSSKLILDR